MQLLLKDKPVLEVQENGQCTILEFDYFMPPKRWETTE